MPTNLSKTFSRNLRRILNERGLSAADMSRALGISKSSISNWMNANRIPRDDTLDILCNYLNVSRGELLEEFSNREQPYYINEETARIAQEVFDDPDLKMLLDASRGVSPENVRLAAEMLRRMKETNG